MYELCNCAYGFNLSSIHLPKYSVAVPCDDIIWPIRFVSLNISIQCSWFRVVSFYPSKHSSSAKTSPSFHCLSTLLLFVNKFIWVTICFPERSFICNVFQCFGLVPLQSMTNLEPLYCTLITPGYLGPCSTLASPSKPLFPHCLDYLRTYFYG